MSEDKNDKSESHDKPPKENPRCDEEQYKLLKECSDNGDMALWNNWRKEGLYKEIWLQGADLGGANLQGAYLDRANLQGANLNDTNLQGADLLGANLQGAVFGEANLKGSNIFVANIKGASFQDAIVDGETIIQKCQVNRHCEGKSKGTDFNGVGINSIRIDSATKQLLQYNIRRINWESWYKGHLRRKKRIVKIRKVVTSPVYLFWSMSDYGSSTARIILWFFILASAFAVVYWKWSNLVIVRGEVGGIRDFVHALYFSVVTMTTLGFGDIAANPDSWYGQVMLMIQVILGYVLLGALVTRFAVLFNADGPAGSFTPMDNETRVLLRKLKEEKKKR